MISIKFEPELRRFVAYDGELIAGSIDLTMNDDRWIIEHTNVDPAFRGQGLGEKLVSAMVDEAGKVGIKIGANCPYAKKLLNETPDFADLVSK